jgi:hypothetical protein
MGPRWPRGEASWPAAWAAAVRTAGAAPAWRRLILCSLCARCSKDAILAQNAGLEVLGNDSSTLSIITGSDKARNGSFEVVCFKDGQEKSEVIFSKLERRAFPDNDELAEAVKTFYASGEVKKIEKTQKSGCVIL